MRIFILLFSLVFSQWALAQTYVGLGLSNTDFKLQNHDSGAGFQLLIGQQVNKFLSLEATYADHGSTSGQLPNGQNSDYDATSIGAGIKVAFAVSSAIDLYAKLGVQRWTETLRYSHNVADNVNFNLAGVEVENGSLGQYYGVGASYLANTRLRFFASYIIFNRNTDGGFSRAFLGSDLDGSSTMPNLTAGVEYRFGS